MNRDFASHPRTVGRQPTHYPNRIATHTALTCLLLMTLASLALAQAGTLDNTFGNAGVFTDNPGPNSGATSVALQSTGKIVIGGSINGRGALLRVNSNGTLDTTFGNAGVVSSRFGIDAEVTVLALAVQPDNKILALATGFPGGLAIGRFNTNGTPDASFGNAGFTARFASGQPGFAGAMALQSNGDIVAGSGFLMSRFNSTGRFDTTFGNAGTASLKVPGPNVNAITIQTDGKILVAAADIGGEGTVSRYNTNGTVDNGFGILGQVATVAPSQAMSLQGDGKVIIGGNLLTTLPASTGFGLVRYLSSGSIDTFYGLRGGVVTSFPPNANASVAATAIQSNGDLIAAGGASSPSSTSEFALARYTSGGLPDSTFGNGGRVLTSFANGGGSIAAMVLQSDGKIVVAGAIGPNFGVARYLAQ